MHRSELVRRITIHLEQHRRPRLLLSGMVMVAGLVGFGVSFGLLSYGIASMAVRYALAGGAAYLSFIGLLRLWSSIDHRTSFDLDPGLIPDVSLDRGQGSRGSGDGLFLGGRSGGGGASSSWTQEGTSRAASVPARRPRSSGASFDVDAEEGLWILVLAAAVLSGLVAIGFVIYAAPALLAEVIVDAVIVSAIYHRVAVKDTRHWAATVVRRTWIAAVVVIASLAAGGYALQRLVPEARSIGPALSALADRS